MPHTSIFALVLASLLLSGCGKFPDEPPLLAAHSTAQPDIAS
ncbi:hypothetical protein ACIOYV_27360 [Pseudomonas sp. NPDC087342]|nr:hypothetical protein [Pseudomonas nunensis]MDN3221890.1 hypothetical protein [Pseudomonas nunensis]